MPSVEIAPVPARAAGARSAPATAAATVGGRAPLILSALVCAAATVPVLVYLWVALHRVGYRFELDWMEGGSVELAARVAGGHSLYVAPSLAYVGWTYTPLYYWIAAAGAKVIGIGFLPLRLLSLAASVASMATIAWMVMRETGDRVAGLAGAGLFAATFQISGAWFDVGRVDSLFLAMTLLTLAVGRRAHGVRGGLVLGVLAFLAFFTKQTALLAVLPALAYLALTRRRAGVAALIALLVLVIASTVLLDASSGGWYGYYVFGELVHQPVAHQLWTGFWIDDVLHRQWPLVILMLAGGAMLAWRAKGTFGHSDARLAPNISALRALDSPAVYYGLAAAGLLGAAWVSRLHSGGFANVLMPAYAAIALLAGLSYGALARGRHAGIARPLLAIAVVLQLGLLAYPIGAQIPTAADRVAGAQLIARLRALPGRVIVLRHPWYATLAGKTGSAQEEAIIDVLRSSETRGSRALLASLHRGLDAQGIQAVVLDYPSDASLFGAGFAREFQLQRAPITAAPLYPLTDLHTAPTLLYLRTVRTLRTRPHRTSGA